MCAASAYIATCTALIAAPIATHNRINVMPRGDSSECTGFGGAGFAGTAAATAVCSAAAALGAGRASGNGTAASGAGAAGGAAVLVFRGNAERPKQHAAPTTQSASIVIFDPSR